MMKSGFKALLLGAVVYAFVGVGCNENTVDPVGTDSTAAPLAPTGLMANSQSGAVALKWTSSASTNVSNYELTVSPAPTSGSSTISIGSALNTYVVSNLTNGTTYSFSLKAKSSTKSSAPATISWAPATRMSGVKVYETASSSFGSGLNFSSGSVLTVANGATWDLGLDTRTVGGAPSYDLGSPSLTSYTFPGAVKTTLISDKRYEGATSLDAVFDTEALGSSAAMAPTTARLINFTSVTQGFVFFAKTAEGNYAKVLVKAVGGKILQGTAPNRYVEMDVSYQSATNIPYASVRSTGTPAFKTAVNSTVKKVSGE
ncbi:MAG: fibronectin type III domain-containing protein [Bacteroidota bacterium]